MCQRAPVFIYIIIFEIGIFLTDLLNYMKSISFCAKKCKYRNNQRNRATVKKSLVFFNSFTISLVLSVVK